jgi:hypothetical protein
LFISLFKKNKKYQKIVELLSNNRNGYTRMEIIDLLGFSDGGELSNIISDLVSCKFFKSL